MPIDAQHAAAQAAASLCQAFRELKAAQHLSGNQAALLLGKSPAWFSVHFPRWERDGLAAFLPPRRELGARRRLLTDLPPWFLPVARFFYLTSNLTHERGSVPEAVRRVISLPVCPPAAVARLSKVCLDAGWQPDGDEKLPTCPPGLRENILDRERAGKPLLPAALARQITIAAPFVKQSRNPTGAGLDFVSAHGTQMLWRNPDTGEETFIRGGDVVEADDATVNFPCVVPWAVRGCPCSERYGVKVARFQWLVAIDVGSRKVLGFSYTARPKSSYRAEDVLSLMRCIVLQHGIPRAWRLEKGVWAANRVVDAVKLMGSGRLSVHSPHAKPFIEGLFSKLWTKLAVWFADASVGRFQGEGEAASKLLATCQAGHQDPRRYFPTLGDAIAAFHGVIEEHGAGQIVSPNYGRWIPNDRWNADVAARPLRSLDSQSAWLFSPFMREWRVKGNTTGGKVPIMPGVSLPYHFSAPFLLHFHGARVRAYFDPANECCAATLVLAQPWHNHRAGEVLGVAPQVNLTAEHIRRALGWRMALADEGSVQLRAAHTALRREVRGIVGVKTAAPVIESEERTGAGVLTVISRGIEPPPLAPIPPPTPPPQPPRHAARRGKIARLPFVIREQLNVRLRDNEPGKSLVAWLNSLPVINGALITESNLSRWRADGYVEWLKQQTATLQQPAFVGRP